MTDHKALYQAAVTLVDAKRCATCEHYQANASGAACTVYECEKYLVNIPF